MTDSEQAAKATVDAIEKGASMNDIVADLQKEMERRCPAHAPSFLEGIADAIDYLFD